MNVDPIEVLRNHQDEPILGNIAKQALQFLRGTQYKLLHSAGQGQSSHSIVRMYEIRKSLKKFKRETFVGLEETIESLRERDVIVHLSAVETEKGLISLWLTDESNHPVGIVIVKFE